MRRVALTLVSTVLVLLALPAPAAAWWEFLEELSGPGWWKGFDVDARLFCLVDKLPPEKEKALAERMKMAASLPSFKVLAGQTQIPAEGTERSAFLKAVRTEVGLREMNLADWERILDEWQQLAGGDADKIVILRLPLAAVRARADRSLAMVAPATEAWVMSTGPRDAGLAAVAQAEQDVAQAAEAYRRAAETMQDIVGRPRMTAAALPGVIYSACKLRPNERRRAAFDVGMRFLWTHDDRFASGEHISFTTIEPAFAWRVIDNPKYDILEYGLGAGFYWISSRAFPSVTGAFVEPARFDFHVPTSFATNDSLSRKIVRSIIFRVGYLSFPGGFEADAFLADPLNPETHRRIGRDWVRYYGFYVDTEVFRKKT